MKVIKHQLVMSTELLRDGRQLSREVVKEAFSKMYDKMPLNKDHDLSMPSVGYTSNHSLEHTDDGQLAIYADVFVDDGFDISGKGLSPGFSTVEQGTTSGKKETVHVEYDKMALSEEEISSLERLSNERLDVVRSPLLLFHEFTTLEWLSLVFVGRELFGGFLSEAGRDVYTSFRKEVKRLCKQKADRSPESIKLTLKHKIDTQHGAVLLTCEITHESLEDDYNSIDFSNCVEYAKSLIGDKQFAELGFRLKPDRMSWELTYFTDKDGNVTRLAI